LETVYKKYRPAHEILIEYYAYYDLRRILKNEWELEDKKYENQCNKLYAEFEEAAKQEKEREENSKSARIAKKLEQMKLSQELVNKIKLRNRDK
tara:strand:- start:1266 stop:1547 length:282 start_codon:yes stop_codon:yes gene_type:complete